MEYLQEWRTYYCLKKKENYFLFDNSVKKYLQLLNVDLCPCKVYLVSVLASDYM